MPHDEEIRRVAEEMRVLLRSLGRDIRQAVDEALRSERPVGEALSRELKGVARRTGRAAGAGWKGQRQWKGQRHSYTWPPPQAWWYGPPQARPGPSDPATGAPGPADRLHSPDQPPGPFTGPPGWCPGPAARRGQRPPVAARRRGHGRRGLPPVRRRWDGRATLALLGVLCAAGWLLSATHLAHVAVETVLALALILLGAVMVITARTDWGLSRRAWPVWLGALVVLALLATSASTGAGSALAHVSVGDIYRQAVPGQTVYGGLGRLTVNAATSTAAAASTAAAPTAPAAAITVESVAGDTVVTNPGSRPLDLDLRVLAGEICVDGRMRASGIDARYSGQDNATGSVAPPLRIQVRQLAGRVLVNGSGCRP